MEYKKLLVYLRIIVGLLILLVASLMVSVYYKESSLQSSPDRINDRVRTEHLVLNDSNMPKWMEPVNTSTFPIADPIVSPDYTKFWSAFDDKISSHITIGDLDSMKFQRANFRRTFLDTRGMLADQDTGRVFTKTGTPVPLARLECLLVGFDPKKPHIIANCP